MQLVAAQPEDGQAGDQAAQLRDQPRAVEVARGLAGDDQELPGARRHGMGAGGPCGKGYIR